MIEVKLPDRPVGPRQENSVKLVMPVKLPAGRYYRIANENASATLNTLHVDARTSENFHLT
jgi:hypothetical protein